MGVGAELLCAVVRDCLSLQWRLLVAGKPYAKKPDESKLDSGCGPLGVQLELPPLPEECAFLDVAVDLVGVVCFTVTARLDAECLLVWRGHSYRDALSELARWEVEGFPVRNLALEALEETELQECCA